MIPPSRPVSLNSREGIAPQRYWTVNFLRSGPDRVQAVDAGVIEESSVSIYVNAQEVATLMCSPVELETLALGYLFNENVITTLDDVRLIKTNASATSIDVYLHHAQFDLPRRMLLTTGCGRNAIYEVLHDSLPALDTAFAITPDDLLARMLDLRRAAQLYRRAGGVHTSLLCTADDVLLSAEDVSRHNTLDRLAGKVLQQRHSTRDRILLTSGRISSEMVVKARRMEVPIVASRSSPTSLAVTYAQHWQISVIGYVRRHHLRVYTHPQRLGIGS